MSYLRLSTELVNRNTSKSSDTDSNSCEVTFHEKAVHQFATDALESLPQDISPSTPPRYPNPELPLSSIFVSNFSSNASSSSSNCPDSPSNSCVSSSSNATNFSTPKKEKTAPKMPLPPLQATSSQNSTKSKDSHSSFPSPTYSSACYEQIKTCNLTPIFSQMEQTLSFKDELNEPLGSTPPTREKLVTSLFTQTRDTSFSTPVNTSSPMKRRFVKKNRGSPVENKNNRFRSKSPNFSPQVSKSTCSLKQNFGIPAPASSSPSDLNDAFDAEALLFHPFSSSSSSLTPDTPCSSSSFSSFLPLRADCSFDIKSHIDGDFPLTPPAKKNSPELSPRRVESPPSKKTATQPKAPMKGVKPSPAENYKIGCDYFLTVGDIECKCRFIGSGSFKNVFALVPNQNTLKEGLKNEELVVKFFKSHVLAQHKPKILQRWNAYADVQRVWCATHGLQFAKQYLYFQDSNVSIEAQIPFPCYNDKLEWENDANVTIDMLPAQIRDRLTQIREYFVQCCRHNFVLDIALDNFRFDAQNRIYLVDFLEIPEDDLKTFFSDTLEKRMIFGNVNIYKYFIAPLKDKPEIYQFFARRIKKIFL